MISHFDVNMAYTYLLGRLPESQTLIAEQIDMFSCIDELRHSIFHTLEFKARAAYLFNVFQKHYKPPVLEDCCENFFANYLGINFNVHCAYKYVLGVSDIHTVVFPIHVYKSTSVDEVTSYSLVSDIFQSTYLKVTGNAIYVNKFQNLEPNLVSSNRNIRYLTS